MAGTAGPPVVDADLDALVESAREARANAYAPYSRYAVGAAVRTAEGAVYAGANVENAMYGATVCAERVAVWAAVASGARRIAALALVTRSGGAPCGFCRQVLREFAEDDMPIAIARPAGPARIRTLGALLPDAWGADDLGDPRP